MPVSLPSLSPNGLIRSPRTPRSGKTSKRKPTAYKSSPSVRTLGKLRKSSGNGSVGYSPRLGNGSKTSYGNDSKHNGMIDLKNGPLCYAVISSARSSMTRSSVVSQTRISSAATYPCRRKKKERRPLCQSGKIVSHRLPQDGDEAAQILSTVLLMYVSR